MNIYLGNRTADTVRIYFEKAKQPEIKVVLPQKARTVEEALEDYRETLLANAKSYGKSDNPASIRVLEKSGFTVLEEFTEDGRDSKYLQYTYG